MKALVDVAVVVSDSAGESALYRRKLNQVQHVGAQFYETLAVSGIQ